jgi:hypothetical protein
MNSSPRQTVSAGNLLRSTLCPRADISLNCLNLYQRLLRVRFCPRGPAMDTLHGSSALPIQVNSSMTGTVCLGGVEPHSTHARCPCTTTQAFGYRRSTRTRHSDSFSRKSPLRCLCHESIHLVRGRSDLTFRRRMRA